MRLIETTSLRLVSVGYDEVPQYAILSHRWEDEEVLFEDMKDLSSCRKKGLEKLKQFCDLAHQLQYRYVWMDSCCIDKSSSAELSEAINSMYKYYQRADICIAYLSDVDGGANASTFDRSFCSSVWFTRCWTLQELLAPPDLTFYNSSWERLGSKAGLIDLISATASIDTSALRGVQLSDFSIAERMAWASQRQATRPEDIAYSLMGIFDVNMPMLYGEGDRAFSRLQEEIIRYSDDETIFAWWPSDHAPSSSGLLATSPADFRYSKYLKPSRLHERSETFKLTNRGLTGSLNLASSPSIDAKIYIAFLNASFRRPGRSERFVGVYIRQVGLDEHCFERVSVTATENAHCWFGSHLQVSSMECFVKQVHIRHRGSKQEFEPDIACGFDLGKIIRETAVGRIPTFSNRMLVDGKEIRLPPGTHWAQRDGAARLVVRLPPEAVGPVCNIQLDPAYYGIMLIQLGVWHNERPYCVLIDDSSKAAQPIKTAVDKFTMYESLKTFEKIDHDKIGWSDMIRTQRDDHIAYKMVPDQPYTGVFSFCGFKSEPTRWLCLQPDPLTGQFKKRSSWAVKFTPYTRRHQHIWGFEIEKVSNIVLYS